MRIVSRRILIAKETYKCDAFWAWKLMGPPDSVLLLRQRAVLASAREDNGQIRPGQRYRRVEFASGDGVEVWRGRLDMCDLCADYDLELPWEVD
jgi:hypothetical protein